MPTAISTIFGFFHAMLHPPKDLANWKPRDINESPIAEQEKFWLMRRRTATKEGPARSCDRGTWSCAGTE